MSDHDADDELARLTQPLPDAEETVRAIYHGAVDAVVVQGPRGPQIVTLKGSEEPYRILVDRMTEGALTVGQDGTILFANRRLAQMTGHPAEDSAGRNLGDFLAEPFADLMRHWLEFPPDRAVRHEVMMCRADGSQFPALLWVGAIVLDQLPALLITATDLTAQKQSEQIAAAERFVRSILEQASDAIIVCDRSGRITHASWAAQELVGRTPIGLRFVEALPLSGMETGAERAVTPVLDAGAIVHHLLAGQSMRNIEVRALWSWRADGFFLLNGGPLLDSHNLTIGCIVTLTDITERRRAEEKQTILVAELNHRVKNILAIVRAVAAQTLVRSLSLSAFKEAFDGRLKALSLAHDILTSIRWGRVELDTLVDQSLAPYRAPGSAPRIVSEGPKVLLPTRAVVPLSMVLHELATNAAKYGALSVDCGSLEVRWGVVERNNGRWVELRWIERNGPPAATNIREGFGTKLIRRSVSYDLDGQADLLFAADGLKGTLAFPILEDPATSSAIATARRGASAGAE
ncbi:HWE histidine kinase domain-containing protein [Xanthobacteraceae bacterium Astr-EGSB]|uniref:sensor histidine kinase n=1 Tax=Astrobacterium formosum TaxID=3069710 RepID=UPI0027AF7A8B|nr:HWE histidine kinase domain-containing protein [Xanthobacteraceae bacterium Astr-EGSB]